VHKKTRRNSALLLLMAPIIAIGSSALVAGTAASAGATAKKAVNPTITICEAAHGAFSFALNGSALTLPKSSCGVFTAKIGINHVSEVRAPALYRTLSSIAVSPASAKVSSSLKTESVTLRLAAGRSATVKFDNSKLVVVLPNPTPVTPPPTNGGPSSPPPSGPPVVNSDPAAPGNGYIEVCKTAVDRMVEGTFAFTITPASGTVTDLSLTPVYGQNQSEACSGPIPVAAGTVTVSEATYGPGYWLAGVTASPTGDLVSVDLATQTANLTVTAGFETTADFADATQLNTIKVCKVLANNLGSLAGTTFNYSVGWTFTPPAALYPPVLSYSGSATVAVVAVAAAAAPLGEACSIVPAAIPAGSVVTVNELAGDPNRGPFVTVSNVSIVPSTFDAATSATPATEAVLTVPADGYADAVFTNLPMGFIEVCKNFDPRRWNNPDNVATFTVNGGAPFTVQGGNCSAPIEVPAGAGTATVDETIGANYYLENISASAVVLGQGPTNELVTAPTVNPAVVNVPYGNVGNETVVTYLNGVDPTSFKICAVEPANTSSQTVSFNWSYTSDLRDLALDPNVYQQPSFDLTIPASDPGGVVCSTVIDGPPLVDPWGDPYVLTFTETSITDPTATVTGISYLGNGWAGSPILGLPGSISITLGLGTNVVTFTNGPAPVE
jgi:hypothetical protein